MAIKFHVTSMSLESHLSVTTLGPEGSVTEVFGSLTEFYSHLEASLKLLDAGELFAVYTSEIVSDSNVYLREGYCDIQQTF